MAIGPASEMAAGSRGDFLTLKNLLARQGVYRYIGGVLHANQQDRHRATVHLRRMGNCFPGCCFSQRFGLVPVPETARAAARGRRKRDACVFSHVAGEGARRTSGLCSHAFHRCISRRRTEFALGAEKPLDSWFSPAVEPWSAFLLTQDHRENAGHVPKLNLNPLNNVHCLVGVRVTL